MHNPSAPRQANIPLYAAALASLAAGACMPLALAPLNWAPLALLAPAILFTQIKTNKPGKAALHGFLFGLGQFGTGVYWVYFALAPYAAAGRLLACLGTAVLICILSLFPATMAYGQARLQTYHPKLGRYAVFVSLWVLTDALRSTLFTGWHWLMLGYTGLALPGIPYLAPLFSVYGLTAVLLFISRALHSILTRTPSQRQSALGLAGLALLCAALHAHGPWTQPFGKPISVALVQGNINSATKWNSQALLRIIQQQHALSLPHWGKDLVVWSENALPTTPNRIASILAQLQASAERHNTNLLIGMPYQDPETQLVFNSAHLLGPTTGHYNKHHLIPWGEYFPMAEWLSPVAHWLNIPMSAFSHGKAGQKPLPLKHGLTLAPFICYEIVLPTYVRTQARNSHLLAVLTDDSWFNPSWATDQHRQMAAMRARELERPLLFVANEGKTSLIDHQGHLQSSLNHGEQAVLIGQIQPRTGQTPWQRFGRLPLCIILGLFLLL